MLQIKKCNLFGLILSALALCGLNADGLASDERVLVVHSYHESFDWIQTINATLRSILNQAGVDQRYYYMDTKRKPDNHHIDDATRQARQILKSYHPHVLIAVDDNAQAYFAKDYINNNDIQIVFCGVNADPKKYGYPATNVTGILERPYPIQTLKVLKILLPGIRKVKVISDVSPTSDQVLPWIKHLAQDLSMDMQIVGYEQPVTFTQWKQAIIDLDQNNQIDALLIPLYHTVREEGHSNSVASAEVMRWTITHTQKPVVGLWPQNVTDGSLLAVTVNPREHGRVAAQMALEILKGKKAGEIPIVVNEEGYVMINLKNKEHLGFDAGIEIDQIADQVIR